MFKQQKGFGGLQLLVVAGTFAALSVVITPEFQAPDHTQATLAKQARIAQALEFAGEARDKVAQSFDAIHSLPRTRNQALAMEPDMASRPDFVTDVKFQHDHAGEMVMIMVHIDYGVVENILGGEQYVYMAATLSGENQDELKWQCGARNIDRNLLPEECLG